MPVSIEQNKIIDSIEAVYRKMAGLPPDKPVDYCAKKSEWEEDRQYGSTYTELGRSTWLTAREKNALNMLSITRDYVYGRDVVKPESQPHGPMRTLKIRTRDSENHVLPEILTVLNLATDQVNYNAYLVDTGAIGGFIPDAIRSIERKAIDPLEHHMLTRIKNDYREDAIKPNKVIATSWDGGSSSLLVNTIRQPHTKLKIRTLPDIPQYGKKHEKDVIVLLESHMKIIDDLHLLKHQ